MRTILTITLFAFAIGGCFRAPASLHQTHDAAPNGTTGNEPQTRTPSTETPAPSPHTTEPPKLATPTSNGYCLARPSIPTEPTVSVPFPIEKNGCSYKGLRESSNDTLRRTESVTRDGLTLTQTSYWPAEDETHTATYLLDELGHVLSYVETRPTSTSRKTQQFDALGRLVRLTTIFDQYTATYSYDYTESGRLAGWRSAVEYVSGANEGVEVSYLYDQSGRILESRYRKRKDGAITLDQLDQWSYDELGRPIGRRVTEDGTLRETEHWTWSASELSRHRIVRLLAPTVSSQLTTERPSDDQTGCRPLPMGWFADYSDSIYRVDQHLEPWPRIADVRPALPIGEIYNHAGLSRDLFYCAFCDPKPRFDAFWPVRYGIAGDPFVEMLSRSYKGGRMLAERLDWIPVEDYNATTEPTDESRVGYRLRTLSGGKVASDRWTFERTAFAGHSYELRFEYQPEGLIARTRLVDDQLVERQDWELDSSGQLRALEWRSLGDSESDGLVPLTWRTELDAIADGLWRVQTFSDDPLRLTEVRTVDESGRLLLYVHPNDDGSRLETSYEYHSSGEISRLQVVSIGADGVAVLKALNTTVYNSAGVLTEQKMSTATASTLRVYDWSCSP
ncbi:MAG: hypothetical protein KC609_21010 [Myxococcales bacterium]|nr:hypothetical protein [Myxococcales bacterium]